MERLIGLLGMAVFIGLALLMSRDRKAIHWKTVGWAMALQWIFGVAVLKGPAISALFSRILHLPGAPRGLGWAVLILLFLPMLLRRLAKIEIVALNRTFLVLAGLSVLWGNLIGVTFDRVRIGVEHLMTFAAAGASFVFGSLADPKGSAGLVFAFVVLPTIIFVASLFAILYYLGVMQFVVGACARAMGRLLKVSGAESVSVAASILMGQTEAPLTIRPFLPNFTRSEMMTIMTAGMAHVSGSIMVAYVQIAHVDVVHLITAVIMTAPGAVMMAKILEPETGTPETEGEIRVQIPHQDANILDAAARGAGEGGQLAFNVAVMLVGFIALVALINGILKACHPSLSMEMLLGYIFRPFAFLMGVPWSDAGAIGSLLGKRMVVNEFVAFIELGQLGNLSTKAKLIATFALCGFANFSSIAIQIGGIGALIPNRRGDLARLGLRAMVAGTLANFLSACIAGILS